MLPCVAFACQRLATAPTDMHMTYMSWSWAEVVMERVTRSIVKKVQVLACCSGAGAVLSVSVCAALVVPVLACAVCYTRAAGNAGRFAGDAQRLHQARCGVHSCVQAAASARVAGGCGIVKSAENGDGASVLCHVIADADAVNKRDE